MNNKEPENKSEKKKGAVREYVEAILVAVLIALVIRSFGVEAFKIPSSSMIPTLMIGDHIFVNKFIYGVRIPLTKTRFFDIKHPERGDVIVFMYPHDEGKDYIKRVVGIPGDKVRVEGTDLYVNDGKVEQFAISVKKEDDKGKLEVLGSDEYHSIPFFNAWRRFNFFEEDIEDKHFLVQYEDIPLHRSGEFEVPEDSYFVMGDNRDNSSDSREWGIVPFDNVKGKAMFVWLSLDKERGGIRFSRIGHWIR